MDADPPAGTTASAEGAEIKTFLIADVRGYTRFTHDRGDEAAADLAGRFAEIVRAGVQARGGVLVELRGDEGLAVFSSARQAIRAAVDLQSALVEATIADPSTPLPVGIGLDAGEAVPVLDGYRGGALNLAARLCAQAGPGEILASQEVLHLARKVEGVRYIERKPVRLKGLDRPVPMTRVVPEGEDPATRLAAVLRAAPSARRAPLRRRRPVLIAVAVLCLLAVVAGLGLVTSSWPWGRHHAGKAVPILSGNGIQLFDATSGRRLGSVSLPGVPSGITSGGGSVWVSDAGAGTVLKVDPDTRAATDTIPVGGNPTGIAFVDGALWVALSSQGEVVRIDPSSDTVVATVDVGNAPTGVAASSGSVWVTNYSDDNVVRVDTATNRVITDSTVLVGNGPIAVAADRDGAWVANSGDGTVTQIPLGGEAPRTIPVGNGPFGIAIGPAGVWVTKNLDGTLSRIDADTGVVLQTSHLSGEATSLAVGDGTIWVADRFSNTISQFDDATGSAGATIQMQAQPVAMTVVGEQLWAAASAPTSAHRGGTLHFASRVAPRAIDPATAYDPQSWQVLTMTNDGLVGFARVGGPQGGAIVADLATSVPAASSDGLTYSFQLRPGIRYSDGSTVEPEDVRLGIERSLVNNGPSVPPAAYYSGIVGAAECSQRIRAALASKSVAPCDLSQGIVVNDASRTITFHLSEPDPEFLYKLALPFADAVPADTPLQATTATPLPATGPYRIESFVPAKNHRGGTIDLVRNPQFAEWSQAAQPSGYPDELQGSYGMAATQEISELEQGELDASDDATTLASHLDELKTRYPNQVHEAVLPSTYGFVMNSQLAPFDDVRVRRAVNFAVDRARLMQVSGGRQVNRVSCQTVPPDFPGYRRYCPYTLHPNASGTWSAPDLAQAQRLIAAAGTAGDKVTILMPTDVAPYDRQTGLYLRSVLRQLHFRAQLRVIPFAKYFARVQTPERSARIQISLWGWVTDYVAPSNILVPLFGCQASSASENTGHFCDHDIQALMDQALDEEAGQPAEADQKWTGADRAIVDQAPWVSLPTQVQAFFVSAGTGDVQVSPQWGGLLLGQLWVN